MITIHPYNPNWPKEFEQIRQALLEVLGPLALRVDHIGSTSVPGLGAKDVIDVQITVEILTSEVTNKLVEAGYQFRGHKVDHVPFGEDDALNLWEKFLFKERSGERRANIHVRVTGNLNQRYALIFRDYLRDHPNAARTIELVKRELAKRHRDDQDAYYAIKDPVYDLIWEAAKAWAEQTGWTLSQEI